MYRMIEDVNFFSKTGNAIYNDEIRTYLLSQIQNIFSQNEFANMQCQHEYIDTFINWIKTSRLNKVDGLETFHHKVISLGVTQALDQFHYKILKSRKKLRLFRGEYPYNRDVHPFDWSKDFIDDRPLEKGDAVVISCPFSATGGVHPRMGEVLEESLRLEIPIFVDLAWYGTCGGLSIDLSHPAISEVAFSLTKGLTCGNYRSGIRLSRGSREAFGIQDRLDLQFEWNHGIHLNTKIGILLMQKFSPDTQYNKFREAQMRVCDEFGLEPSLCVHIATGGENWSTFSRDGIYNRVNLRDAIKKMKRKYD
jgi:hypothetical protein